MSRPELIEPDEIGAFLRRARELRGWSQTKLGDRCRKSHAEISLLENGHRALRLGHLIKLLDVLGYRLRLELTPMRKDNGEPDDRARADRP
ncbi:helix-turn-helix domain-containing protein [Burkholderia ambifaria]